MKVLYVASKISPTVLNDFHHEMSVVVYDKKMDGIKDPDYQILLIFSLTH